MVDLASIPDELRRAPRAIPRWAPSIGYLITMVLMLAVFVAGPGVVGILLGVLVDVPMKIKATAIAIGIALIVLAALFLVFPIRRRRVYRTGTLVSTRIDKRVERRLKVNGVSMLRYVFEYTFQGPGGLTKGKAELDSLGTQQLGFLPDAGDTVFVTYDPATPKRNYAWSYARDGAALWVPGVRR